jgi:hypothetical protein
MDSNGYLTLLMNFIAPIALGLALVYVLWKTRFVNWRQRQHTEKATEDLYDRVENQRERREHTAQR